MRMVKGKPEQALVWGRSAIEKNARGAKQLMGNGFALAPYFCQSRSVETLDLGPQQLFADHKVVLLASVPDTRSTRFIRAKG